MPWQGLLEAAWWIMVVAVVFFLSVLTYAICHNAIWGGKD